MKTSVNCDYAVDDYKLHCLYVHMGINLKFTEHMSKIVNIGHSRAALILRFLQVIMRC